MPEEDFPRVDSLIHLPEVQRLLPRGIEMLWSAGPVSNQGGRSYYGLYAVATKPTITGEYLTHAQAEPGPISNPAGADVHPARCGRATFRPPPGAARG